MVIERSVNVGHSYLPARINLSRLAMRTNLRVKYIAAEIHALLFVSMWLLYAGFSQPLADGPSKVPFVILLVADFPISLVAFGIMFNSAEMGNAAAVLWGAVGTLWWFGIGSLFHPRIAADSDSEVSWRKELLVSATLVTGVVAVSIVLQWRGWQGHFDEGELRSLTFAPDGQSVLMVRSRNNSSRFEDLNSAVSTPVGKSLPCSPSSPTYSPDGMRVAFACETRSTGVSRILIMDADGSNLHPLFSSQSNNYDFAPHFVSDGKEIYFGRSPSYLDDSSRHHWDVYSAWYDGTNERRLTTREFEDFGVSFSRDGRKFILAGDNGSGTRLSLYTLEEPEQKARAIQPSVPNMQRAPIISDVTFDSGGQGIYFLAANDGKGAFDYDVFRFDLANNLVEKLTAGNGYATKLSVSNDGKTAVFLRWTGRWGLRPNLSRLNALDMHTKKITPLNVTGSE
jgi:WD40-like Beta Propeller Repeat